MSDNSTTPRKKPPAPTPGRQPKTPGYKPFWHSRGGWTIKINGKGVYLGRDTKKAEEKFREKVLPNIRTGHAPNADRLTLGKLVAAYLKRHESRVENGELTKSSYRYLVRGCRAIVDELGPNFAVEDIRPLDLIPIRDRIIGNCAPNTAEKYIRNIRSLLMSAHESFQLIDSPVRMGDALRAPEARSHREYELKKGKKHLTCEEIARLLRASDARWRAMILLGYFAGFYPSDLAQLPMDKLELSENDGWLDWHRPKTFEHRRAYLPPLLVRPLREYLNSRPEPETSESEGLVFLNQYGRQMSAGGLGQLSKTQFARVGLENATFRFLRNSCATVGDEVGDGRALSLAMGHKQATSGHALGKGDMTGRYVKQISNERLQTLGSHLERRLLDAMETVQ